MCYQKWSGSHRPIATTWAQGNAIVAVAICFTFAVAVVVAVAVVAVVAVAVAAVGILADVLSLAAKRVLLV